MHAPGYLWKESGHNGLWHWWILTVRPTLSQESSSGNRDVSPTWVPSGGGLRSGAGVHQAVRALLPRMGPGAAAEARPPGCPGAQEGLMLPSNSTPTSCRELHYPAGISSSRPAMLLHVHWPVGFFP